MLNLQTSLTHPLDGFLALYCELS